MFPQYNRLWIIIRIANNYSWIKHANIEHSNIDENDHTTYINSSNRTACNVPIIQILKQIWFICIEFCASSFETKLSVVRRPVGNLLHSNLYKPFNLRNEVVRTSQLY